MVQERQPVSKKINARCAAADGGGTYFKFRCAKR